MSLRSMQTSSGSDPAPPSQRPSNARAHRPTFDHRMRSFDARHDGPKRSGRVRHFASFRSRLTSPLGDRPFIAQRTARPKPRHVQGSLERDPLLIAQLQRATRIQPPVQCPDKTWSGMYEIIRIGGGLSRRGRLATALRILPRPVHPWLYPGIARNRYRLGRADLSALSNERLRRRLMTSRRRATGLPISAFHDPRRPERSG